MQGRSEGIPSVEFEVLMINCHVEFINLFIFNCLTSNINLLIVNCLTSNLCLTKNISFTSRRERLLMDVHSQFRILISPGKMMTCYLRNRYISEVLHPLHEYTKMRIPNKKYQTNTVRTFRGTWSVSALSYLGVDHFGRYRMKI